MPRTVKEWIGKNDDQSPPTHVRLRVFDRHRGVCHRSKRKIYPGEFWQCDHVVALINGGENRESNLAPILTDKHKEKTAEDVAEKSDIYEKRARHIGAKTRRPWHPNLRKKVNGTVVKRN